MAERKQPATTASPIKNNRDEHLRKLRESLKFKAEQERKNTPAYVPDPADTRRDVFSVKNKNPYINDASNQEHKQKIKPKGKQNNLLYIVLCLTLVTLICTVVFAGIVFTQYIDIMNSRRVYTSLQEMADPIESNTATRYISAFDAEMRRINPDYICWIRIDGTVINYPVVRTDNNEKYLDRSFYGEENSLGTLFMDYRCVGEYVPHIIIYGHNTRQGDMFGGLRRFLDERYRMEHPTITLIINDRIVEYEIFAARRTDINDPAYFIDFSVPGSFRAFAERNGAPLDATQIITLSTCVSEGNDDERIIVQGVLR
jgi:sortase B